MTPSVFTSPTLPVVALLLGLLVSIKPAVADSFSVQYFEVPTGTVDFYNRINVPIGVSTNYVTSTLGPSGLPVYVGNGNYTASGIVNPPASVYLDAFNQLLYWSPSNPSGGLVTTIGTGTLSLSSTPINMYAPGTGGPGTGGANGGGNDAVYEQTSILSGVFVVPAGQTDLVAFNIGADDMAFAYVNGQLVESLAGIHDDTSAPGSVFTYGPGTYDLKIFYADRDAPGATLSFTDTGDFSDNSETDPVPTPEPRTIILLGIGLIGAVRVIRHRPTI